MKTDQKVAVCHSINEVREKIREIKTAGNTIGFVPTMGALHEGHISLFSHAAKSSDVLVASIFVNPEQFGPNEDFDRYPRQLEEDLKVCANENISVVFAPSKDEMYDEKKYLQIKIEQLNKHLCGASRPGFFEGILLIVNKLFNIIEPDVAVFGQKDYQQFQIIKQMVREFNHAVDLEMAPIIRANDGLALSSRNTYLSDEQRLIAPSLYRTLSFISDQIKSGVHKPALLISHQKDELEAKGLEVDYLNVYTSDTLQPVTELTKGEKYLIAGAVYAGETRLIDNILTVV